MEPLLSRERSGGTEKEEDMNGRRSRKVRGVGGGGGGEKGVSAIHAGKCQTLTLTEVSLWSQ